ncbi:MAG: thiamine phosphate synthase [Hyphomonadaceae bacterium]|nr:thiamine phosphate synthase [Hyphomonadaceae bacterium]
MPRLWFFTDPERTPEPWRTATQLPAGSAVVYRHFGAPDRLVTARRLQRLCVRRGLRLIVGADAALARAVTAAGIHLPERMAAEAASIKQQEPGWIVTVAAHSAERARASCCADAIMLSAIYPSQSPSAGEPIGLPEGGRIAKSAPAPVVALGGVTVACARELARAGFAGMAGINLFVE